MNDFRPVYSLILLPEKDTAPVSDIEARKARLSEVPLVDFGLCVKECQVIFDFRGNV